jgi:hypothetical protein
MLGFMGVIAVVIGCEKEQAKPVPAGGGHASPPLSELVDAAVASGPPKAPDTSYTPPARIDVPALQAPDLDFLPRDEEGYPVIAESFGVRIRVNRDQRDAVTAMGACVDRVASCVEPQDRPGGRSVDACWIHVPKCATDHPWDEPGGCCPSRCIELYEALRKRTYPDTEASLLTMRSYCFNGMRELMERTR